MNSRPSIPETLRQQILDNAKYRCGYCQAPQELLYAVLRIDHIIPISAGGLTEENNLWASCEPCNSHKSSRTTAVDTATGEIVPLFNPVHQIWSEHFTWAEDKATIFGITSTGRATVDGLKINEIMVLTLRRRWVSVGWYPPS